ncbi:ATP-binding cassette domain-containing protein [bacterium]|nr:ATP-binding cassette domain-containing protein [bacterium]
MAPNPAITVEDLSHHYGERAALDRVSCQIEAGSITGFLGPNGGGKTTLFSILSTLLPIQDGQVAAIGFDLRRQAGAYRQQIGVTFQTPALDRRLTVHENLIHQGHLYGLSGRSLSERIAELLTRFHVANRADDLVETLSGGLKRRVELAKCLLHDPQLLLLDEPSNGLDPGARHDLWQCLEELRGDRGTTIVVATHLMEEAERCDALSLLDAGQIVASGSPSELRGSIPGETISIVSDQPEELRRRIIEAVPVEVRRTGELLRIQQADCQGLLHDLVSRFSGEFKTISLGKATLEDVFLARTGHRLAGEES